MGLTLKELNLVADFYFYTNFHIPIWFQIFNDREYFLVFLNSVSCCSREIAYLTLGVRLLTSVNSAMSVKTAGLRKGRTTDVTGERFHSSVDSRMYMKRRYLSKRFHTDFTGVRLLTSVNSAMNAKIAGLRKGRTTDSTVERFISSVNSRMHTKIRFLSK